ncbi:capping complex subunit for YIEGIA [Bacillus sp. JJ722]|uniref:capping complex subunit for YIEGIA n=1 Tax=Bacillus sp. JJ722 TaxID=3122973 RepID=UPI002FFDDEB4
MVDIKIYAIIATQEHNDTMINPGNVLLLRANDKEEQDLLMREVALAVAGDVVKLSNGMYMILTSAR